MESPPPNYGISRIDQPEKKNHGFYVRITYRGKTHQKFFPDKALGGRVESLKKATEHRDVLLAQLPSDRQAAASRRRQDVQQSGVKGVTHVVSRDSKGNPRYHYWQAAWIVQGRRKTKKFSICSLGNDEALRLAIDVINKIRSS